jgi:hypothetical protein
MNLANPRNFSKKLNVAVFAVHIAIALAFGFVVGALAIEPLAAMVRPAAAIGGTPVFLALSPRATIHYKIACNDEARLGADPTIRDATGCERRLIDPCPFAGNASPLV